jgi:hypothetical protein
MADPIQQIYFTTLTAVGEAKDAKAKALGTPIKFTEMAVGDGGGVLPVPDRTRTSLVNMKRRALLNTLKPDPKNPAQLIAEQVIPEDEGGFWIRELGLYDADGDLFAIGNCPETYKPVLAQGSGRTQVVRMVLVMTSAATVQLKVDPSIVLATRQYVDDQDAAHAAALDPHPQYLTEAEGAARIAAAVAALVNSSPAALDTLAELAAALNNDKDFAATMAAALALKAPLASPAFTGNPTVPTAGLFDADTSAANTAFVQRALGNLAGVRSIGESQALSAADIGKVLINLANAPITLTLPPKASVQAGSTVRLLNFGSAPVAVVAAAGDSLNNNTPIASLSVGTNDNAELVFDGALWRISGAAAALSYSSLFSALKAGNGHTRLPNGLIFQWAGAFVASGQSISLPIAFPNAMFTGMVGAANGAAWLLNSSTTAPTIAHNAGGSQSCAIFAIGY